MEFIGTIDRFGDTDIDGIIFPNGYSVAITFGGSSLTIGGSRFESRCRKSVLKDPQGNIISEVREKNPHQIPEDILISFFGW